MNLDGGAAATINATSEDGSSVDQALLYRKVQLDPSIEHSINISYVLCALPIRPLSES